MYGYVRVPTANKDGFMLFKAELLDRMVFVQAKNKYIVRAFYGEKDDDFLERQFINKNEAQAFLQNLFEDIAKENGHNTELKKKIVNEIADANIEKLDFSIRTYNTLKRAGVRTIGDLSKLTKEQLKDMRNMGSRSLEEVLQKQKDLHIEREIKKIDKVKDYLFGED